MTELRASATPASVTWIGWLWIAFGALIVFSSVMAGVAYWATADQVAEAAEVGFRGPMGFVFGHYPVFVLLQFVFGGVGIVTAIEFLRRQPWTRLALEGLTWGAIALLLGTQLLVLTEVLGTASSGELAIIVFLTFGVGIAFFLVPAVLMLRALRGQVVRDALKPPASD